MARSSHFRHACASCWNPEYSSDCKVIVASRSQQKPVVPVAHSAAWSGCRRVGSPGDRAEPAARIGAAEAQAVLGLGLAWQGRIDEGLAVQEAALAEIPSGAESALHRGSGWRTAGCVSPIMTSSARVPS
jgi:hypothetical protein